MACHDVILTHDRPWHPVGRDKFLFEPFGPLAETLSPKRAGTMRRTAMLCCTEMQRRKNDDMNASGDLGPDA